MASVVVCSMRILTVAIAVVLVTATLSCPPGFVSQGNSCVCADWPDGIITCDEDSLNASIQIGHCMTYDNETGEVRAGYCQQAFFRNDSYKFYYPLPTEVSALNDHVCGPSNRDGLLCGECQDGFAIPPLFTVNCINCTSVTNGWIKFITFTYLPITIIFTVIVVFAISVVSGPINSFIFCGQITTAPFLGVGFIVSVLRAQGTFTYSYKTSTVTVAALYGMWNLYIFRAIIPPFCLTNHLSTLQAYALEYVLAFYPLVVIVFLYVCIRLHASDFRPVVYCWKPFLKCFLRFRRSVDPKTSIIDAFATFILLSYVKLLLVSGKLLYPTHLFNGQGQKLNASVFAYNASIQFFHTEHLPYAILSIIVLLTFIAVPPIVLVFYQAAFFQKCLTRCKMNSQALRTFVEAFQGCYKDGTNGTRDCRYFAGLYFILRVIGVLLSSSTVAHAIAGSALLYWCTALLFALVQPYKVHLYNVVDSAIFALIGTAYIVIMLTVLEVVITGHSSTSLLILIDVLYSLPLLYFVLFIVCWLLIRKTGCIQKLKSHKLLLCFFQETEEDVNAAVPHRLLNPEQYEVMSDGSQAGYQKLLRVENSSNNTYGSLQ